MREELIKIMRIAYQLQLDHPRQCPRGRTSAIILDASLQPIAAARNLLREGLPAPCECDCGTDTLVGAGLTCQAVHSEAGALDYLKDKPTLGQESYMITTRPPCKRCLPLIVSSNIKVIVTTDQYPDRDHSKDAWPGTWLVLPHEDCI